MTGTLTDAVAWLVVGLYVAGAALDASGRRRHARTVTVAAWAVFGLFWLLLVPHFAITKRSIIEGALSLGAVPACLYVGYQLWTGRDSLFTLSRAMAVMGVVYLPVETLAVVRRPLVEAVTRQVAVVIHALGYDPAIASGTQLGYRNMFVFVGEGGHRYSTEVLLACTGVGSMSIFAGLITAVEAPLGRKLRALAVALPVIYLLNVLRVTFIALAHGNQWFRTEPIVGPVLLLFGSSDPNMVSFFVADRIIAQSLSVVALVAIAWIVARELPELLGILDDLAGMVTGREHDLESALAP